MLILMTSSIPKNTMFDFADRPIRRTYIGKVYVNSGAIQQIVPTPLGTEYVLPFNYQLFSSTRYILNNPFIEEVDTIAEVLYDGYWGPWIGIKLVLLLTDLLLNLLRTSSYSVVRWGSSSFW